MSRSNSDAKPRHRLNGSKIVETARNLASDIKSQMPSSTLALLADELAALAAATEERSSRARRPLLVIRALSALAIGLAVLGISLLVRHLHTRWEFSTIADFFVGINAGFNLLILIAGALWFCLTLEIRVRRAEVLAYLEELREFVHVVDVTQLYYTPDLYRYRHAAAPVTLVIDEMYLLHCTQMLAVISNLAALYTRGAAGDSILRAASDIERLAIVTSTKHLTKAGVVREINKELAKESPESSGRVVGRPSESNSPQTETPNQ